MEKIKRTAKQKVRLTDIGNNQAIIEPDPDATYSFKILLTERLTDLGFFEAIDQNNVYSNTLFGIGEELL
jgi:hypothetical protein